MHPSSASSVPFSRASRRQRSRSRYPYTRKERMLVVFFCLQFSLLLWSFGLTRLWEQVVFTAFSVVGLILALMPQWWDRGTGEDPRLCAAKSWQRLTVYPVFWCGLGVAVLCLIHHLNPAYGYEETVVDWRAFPVGHTHWLPRGVASPFDKMSALRFLLVFAGPWLMVCYLKAGVIRRNSVIRMLEFIALSLVALGVLILAQKQTGATGIYWHFEVFPDFVGTIPYKNRAAAVLNLGMTLMMALYFLHLKAMRMELHHSGPHLVVFVGVVFVYGLLWTTQSRTGLLIGSLLMLAFLLLTLIPSLRDGSTWTHKLILSGAMVLLALVGILYTKSVPDRSETLERFGDLREEIRQWHSNARLLSTRITLEMWQQRWLLGWGAGSWRFIFPYYQEDYPSLRYLDGEQTTPAIWSDALNDWAQYLAEFGIVGGLLLLGCFGWVLMESLFLIRQIHLTQVILGLGLLGLFAHALIDLLLQNQAVLGLLLLIGFLMHRLNHEHQKPSQMRSLGS